MSWSRVCIVCNVCFETNRSLQKICSFECRKKHQKSYAKKIEYEGYLKMRFDLFKRDDFRCQYCGRTPQDKAILVVEHIHPVAKGGSIRMNNLITSCSDCNAGKHDRLLELRQQKKFQELAGGYIEYNRRFEERWKNQMAYLEGNRG